MIETTRDTFPGLFWGYLVVWGLLSLYILYLGIRCGRLETRLQQDSEKDREKD